MQDLYLLLLSNLSLSLSHAFSTFDAIAISLHSLQSSKNSSFFHCPLPWQEQI